MSNNQLHHAYNLCSFPKKEIEIVFDTESKHHHELRNTIKTLGGDPESSSNTFSVVDESRSVLLCHDLAYAIAADMCREGMSDVSMYRDTIIVKYKKPHELVPDDFEALIQTRINRNARAQDALVLMVARRISLHFRSSDTLDIDSFVSFVCGDIVKDIQFWFKNRILGNDDSYYLTRFAAARFAKDTKFLRDILIHDSHANTKFIPHSKNQYHLHFWHDSEGKSRFAYKHSKGLMFPGEAQLVVNAIKEFSPVEGFLQEILNHPFGVEAYVATLALVRNVVIYNNNEVLAEYIRENNEFFKMLDIKVVAEKHPAWYDAETNSILDSDIKEENDA